jgi:hypothetical protein
MAGRFDWPEAAGLTKNDSPKKIAPVFETPGAVVLKAWAQKQPFTCA